MFLGQSSLVQTDQGDEELRRQQLVQSHPGSGGGREGQEALSAGVLRRRSGREEATPGGGPQFDQLPSDGSATRNPIDSGSVRQRASGILQLRLRSIDSFEKSGIFAEHVRQPRHGVPVRLVGETRGQPAAHVRRRKKSTPGLRRRPQLHQLNGHLRSPQLAHAQHLVPRPDHLAQFPIPSGLQRHGQLRLGRLGRRLLLRLRIEVDAVLSGRQEFVRLRRDFRSILDLDEQRRLRRWRRHLEVTYGINRTFILTRSILSKKKPQEYYRRQKMQICVTSCVSWTLKRKT